MNTLHRKIDSNQCLQNGAAIIDPVFLQNVPMTPINLPPQQTMLELREIHKAFKLTEFVKGQTKVTHVPLEFVLNLGDFHPEMLIFLMLSWAIVMHNFVCCSIVYLKIIVKYDGDHH